VLREHLSIHEVDDQTHLFSDLALDSIQQLTFVVELENEFRVRFRDEDEREIATVHDVIEAVGRALARERNERPS
jgi:acyl carrier protein